MVKKNKSLMYLYVDELFPVEEIVRIEEKEFVKQFLKNSTIEFSDDDRCFIMSDKDLIYYISIIIREYEYSGQSVQ
jgi:hypothetical protein